MGAGWEKGLYIPQERKHPCRNTLKGILSTPWDGQRGKEGTAAVVNFKGERTRAFLSFFLFSLPLRTHLPAPIHISHGWRLSNSVLRRSGILHSPLPDCEPLPPAVPPSQPQRRPRAVGSRPHPSHTKLQDPEGRARQAGPTPGLARGPAGGCSPALGRQPRLRTATRAGSYYNAHSAPRGPGRARRARRLPGAVVTAPAQLTASRGREESGGLQVPGCIAGRRQRKPGRPGRMTRAMEGSRVPCGCGERAYRRVEGEGALVFVDPVSSLGDPDSRQH